MTVIAKERDRIHIDGTIHLADIMRKREAMDFAASTLRTYNC